MNSRKQNMWQHRITASVIAVLVLFWTIHGRAQNTPPPIPADEQPEVLTRGPVHEAFAEPVSLQYQAGLVAPSQPPPNIEEIPPADRPAGDHFVWVPGYWSWDGDRNNYIWVSACWRAAPPRMSWLPGYWSPVSGGWEWVPGFWAAEGAQEIEYLPTPPANDAVEASGPPPTVDSEWVPPCWYRSEGQYLRRPGYWLTAQPNWVWVASHYVWTPRGYVFAEGHWDYPLESRGVLFAPVYIPLATYARPGYAYSPSVVIDIDVLSASLFVSPRYSHYYFGDYYDDAYIRVGIYPWFDRTHSAAFYDPIYEHDRARFSRTEPRWAERQQHDYDVRRADKDLRPPRTYRDMETRVAKAPEPQRKSIQVVQSLSVIVNNTNNRITNTNTNTITSTRINTTTNVNPVKFEKISPQTHAQIAKQAADVKKFRDERKGWESAPRDPKAVQPANSQKAPVIPPPALKAPVAVPAAERRAPAATPANPPAPAVQPAERKAPAAQPSSDRKPAVIPPREVRAGQPEKVKIPAPPLVGKAKAAGAADKVPPPKPADEVKRKADAKDAPKKDDKATPRASDRP